MYPIILNSDQDMTYIWMGQGLILKASVGAEFSGPEPPADSSATPALTDITSITDITTLLSIAILLPYLLERAL
jgi:hypothetical protein